MDHIAPFLEYLKRHRCYDHSTIREYRRYLYKGLAFLGKPIENADSREIDAACLRAAEARDPDRITGHDDRGATIRWRMATDISIYLKWCEREGIIQKNPYTFATFPKPRRRQAQGFSEAELERLRRLAKTAEPVDRVIISILLDTGVRISELASIRLKDIRLSEPYGIHIPFAKGRKWRTVPMTRKTAEAIRTHLASRTRQGEWLIMGSLGRRMSDQCVSKRLRMLGIRNGFRIHAHRFRHSVGLEWAEAGAHPAAISNLFGHTDFRQTMEYIHYSGKRLRAVQKRVRRPFEVVRELEFIA